MDWKDMAAIETEARRSEQLLSDLEQLARPRHARWDELGLMAVRSFLLEQLQALGPVEQHRFGEGADAGVNLILRLPGQRPELAPVLVAAHYDGPLGSPGADDNATGVAALLAMLNSCASGVSVVNIDNGFAAGYVAALINRLADRE